MIVKNEARNLPRCLTSVRPHVDEIVVVDTGSEDDTVAIAREFGAVLGHFQWCNDFAAARNASLALATSDWVLVLDADEELSLERAELRNWLMGAGDRLAGYVHLVNVAADGTPLSQGVPMLIPRLARNLPDLRYELRFHEQLRYQGRPLDDTEMAVFPQVVIRHYGYTPALIREKSLNRNIPILENIRQNEGLSLMQLAALAGLYVETGQTEKAQNCYAEALDRLTPNLLEGTKPERFGLVPSLLHRMAVAAYEQQDYETVRVLCQRGLEWCDTFPPLNHLTGELMRTLGFPRGAIAYYDYCLQLGQQQTYYQGETFDPCFVTTFPYYGKGCALLSLGELPSARTTFEAALECDPTFTPARDQLVDLEQLISSPDGY